MVRNCSFFHPHCGNFYDVILAGLWKEIMTPPESCISMDHATDEEIYRSWMIFFSATRHDGVLGCAINYGLLESLLSHALCVTLVCSIPARSVHFPLAPQRNLTPNPPLFALSFYFPLLPHNIQIEGLVCMRALAVIYSTGHRLQMHIHILGSQNASRDTCSIFVVVYMSSTYVIFIYLLSEKNLVSVA